MTQPRKINGWPRLAAGLTVALIVGLTAMCVFSTGCVATKGDVAAVKSDLDARIGTTEQRVERVEGDVAGVKVEAEVEAGKAEQRAESVAGDLSAVKAEVEAVALKLEKTQTITAGEDANTGGDQTGLVNLAWVGGAGVGGAGLGGLALWLRFSRLTGERRAQLDETHSQEQTKRLERFAEVGLEIVRSFNEGRSS